MIKGVKNGSILIFALWMLALMSSMLMFSIREIYLNTQRGSKLNYDYVFTTKALSMWEHRDHLLFTTVLVLS